MFVVTHEKLSKGIAADWFIFEVYGPVNEDQAKLLKDALDDQFPEYGNRIRIYPLTPEL